ncbi:protein slit-like [Culicoides brevitarsis]|uniref:protein slit-like n=1 Tax=Culicoides brevitarsis TaxID=469753 RepID=UPI00307B2FBE
MRLKTEHQRMKIWIFLLILAIHSFQQITSTKWDNELSMECPFGCACQHTHMNDLSVTRWINGMSRKKMVDTDFAAEDTNDAMLEDEFSNSENPLVKSATCFLQQKTNVKDFIASLPTDLQVLVVLYGGGKENITIHTSEISALTDLRTLEIRGTTGKDLQLVFDEPLEHLKHVNLEAVELLGIEHAKRRPNYSTYNPSDHFDYVPESEKVEYNMSLKIVSPPEVEIVPYEVYLLEKKRSKTVTFYGWDSLEILRIHDCQLDELYWEIFDGLESLQHLSLEHNQIKIVPAFAFFGAMHIKTLSLARNEILDLNYRALAGLLELEELDLSYNNMSKLSELSFPPFPKLEIMDLRHNPIKYIFPMTFGVMNFTRILHLGDETTALELNQEDHFEQLSELRELRAMNVSAESINAESLKGLVSLEKLTMRGVIKLVEFDAFADKPKLRELILSDCSIEEISMDTLFGIESLQIIDLSKNKLTSIPYGLLDEQKSLKEIYLQENFLTELPNNFFSSLTSLRLARLTDNPWKCSCSAMTLWRQGVTNKVRVVKPATRKCVVSMESTKKMDCKTIESWVEYVYDNKMSPRCASPSEIAGRGVYYAIRRDLRCPVMKAKRKENDKKVIEKKRIANKMTKTYVERLAAMNHHPLAPGSTFDAKKHERQKALYHSFHNKLSQSIMRENSIKNFDTKTKNFRKIDDLNTHKNDIF